MYSTHAQLVITILSLKHAINWTINIEVDDFFFGGGGTLLCLAVSVANKSDRVNLIDLIVNGFPVIFGSFLTRNYHKK